MDKNELLQCVSIQRYIIPMYGNTRPLPYGTMIVKDRHGTGKVRFGNVDRVGRAYITFRHRRHYYRNIGDLYHPVFEFYQL